MSGPIRRGLLWLQGRTLDRVALRAARRGGGPFSLVRHVGRRSGETYETPVVLAPVPEGFAVELAYGEDVNWLRNAEAAGGCVVRFGGKDYRVDAIEPLDAAAGRAAFPPVRRALLTATRRKRFRLLRSAEAAASSSPGSASPAGGGPHLSPPPGCRTPGGSPWTTRVATGAGSSGATADALMATP